MKFNVSVHSNLTAQLTAQVHELITAATFTDDLAPLSEHVLIHLQHGGDQFDEHLIAQTESNEVIGYLHLDKSDEVSGPVVEVVVHPNFRNNKVGTTLVTQAMDRLQDSRLRLWAHGELASAHALAKKLGFSKARELWQMRRSLYAELPKVELPAGQIISNFQVGQDESVWLDLNAKVFAAHPEQGRLERSDLEIRMQEKWFDPAGFFISRNSAGELTGYNWTKIHTDGPLRIGEIYVLGVSPAERGTGLGKALAITGLDYLRAQGLSAAMLYVDLNNASAIKLYEGIGFAHWDTDVMFQAETT